MSYIDSDLENSCELFLLNVYVNTYLVAFIYLFVDCLFVCFLKCCFGWGKILDKNSGNTRKNVLCCRLSFKTLCPFWKIFATKLSLLSCLLLVSTWNKKFKTHQSSNCVCFSSLFVCCSYCFLFSPRFFSIMSMAIRPTMLNTRCPLWQSLHNIGYAFPLYGNSPYNVGHAFARYHVYSTMLDTLLPVIMSIAMLDTLLPLSCL